MKIIIGTVYFVLFEKKARIMKTYTIRSLIKCFPLNHSIKCKFNWIESASFRRLHVIRVIVANHLKRNSLFCTMTRSNPPKTWIEMFIIQLSQQIPECHKMAAELVENCHQRTFFSTCKLWQFFRGFFSFFFQKKKKPLLTAQPRQKHL